MSNDYDYVQVEAIVKEVVSHKRGSPTEIAKLYAFEHLLAQGRYAEIVTLKNEIQQWKDVARMLADELTEANSQRLPVSWEDASESSPAWIAYVNLRDKEK